MTAFSIEQVKFLQYNYSSMGAFNCSKLDIFRNHTARQIGKKANSLNLFIDKKTKNEIQKQNSVKLRPIKSIDEYRVDVRHFTHVKNKEVAYMLGLLWSDGYIYKNIISLEGMASDLNEVEDLFKSTGDWRVYTRVRKNRTKVMKHLSTSNKILYGLLKDFDYEEKSIMSADKILNHIDDNLKPFWWRGYFDGDGCIYVKNSCNQLVFSGSHDQNWIFVENLMKNLNVNKFSISRSKSKRGDSSRVRVCNKRDISKIANYMYQNYDDIGFSRKFMKIKQFLTP